MFQWTGFGIFVAVLVYYFLFCEMWDVIFFPSSFIFQKVIDQSQEEALKYLNTNFSKIISDFNKNSNHVRCYLLPEILDWFFSLLSWSKSSKYSKSKPKKKSNRNPTKLFITYAEYFLCLQFFSIGKRGKRLRRVEKGW